jgi:hypothetical protein
MKVMTARVVNGKEAVELDEGAAVIVLAADDDEFRLTAAEEEELVNAVHAIRGGDYVDGRQLVDELKRR